MLLKQQLQHFLSQKKIWTNISMNKTWQNLNKKEKLMIHNMLVKKSAIGKTLYEPQDFFEFIYKLCQKCQWNPPPWKKTPIVVIDWNEKRKEKQRNLNLASNKRSKNYPKIMYDCHTDRKHSIFFRLGTQWPKNYYIFRTANYPPLKDKKILPPSNFGTLNPPDCACLLRLHISGPRATQTYFCDDPKKNIFLQ